MSLSDEQYRGTKEPNSLLSICIPTFDRPDTIKGCIESLAQQASEFEIPIYVSVNKSPGAPKISSMLSSLKRDVYQRLSFAVAEKFSSVDEGLIHAVSMASSKYVWAIGDKTRVFPGSIKRMVKHLVSHQYDLIIINFIDDNGVHRLVRLDNDRAYNSASRVLTDFGWYTSLLGTLIVPLDAWKRKSTSKYMGTYFANSAIPFDYLASLERPSVLFVAHPLAYRAKKVAGIQYRGFADNLILPIFIRGWNNAIDALPAAYSNEVKKAAKMSRRFSEYTLIDLRARGSYDVERYKEYSQDFTQSTSIRLSYARLIAACPIAPLKLLKALKLGYYDRLPGFVNRVLGVDSEMLPRARESVRSGD